MKARILFIQLLVLFVIGVVTETHLLAQVPQTMSFQAILRNAEGDLTVNTIAGIRIAILQGSTSGPEVFAETHQSASNSQGRISLEIGSGTPVVGILSLIDWSAGPFFLKTETDPGGGVDYSIQSVTPLLSVPYAFHVSVTDTLANSITEQDPFFQSSAAAGISDADTTSWNAAIQPVVAGEGITLIGNTINAPQSHWIGENYQGGIIVALWKTEGVEHGLIAATSLIGTYQYSNISGIFIGNDAWNGMMGQQNTAAIIAQPGHTGSAALTCSAYGDGTWYLPSAMEMKTIFQNRFMLEKAGVVIYTNYYWTSTENANTDTGSTAYTMQNFQHYSGTLTAMSKINYAYAWPVRRF